MLSQESCVHCFCICTVGCRRQDRVMEFLKLVRPGQLDRPSTRCADLRKSGCVWINFSRSFGKIFCKSQNCHFALLKLSRTHALAREQLAAASQQVASIPGSRSCIQMSGRRRLLALRSTFWLVCGWRQLRLGSLVWRLFHTERVVSSYSVV